MSRGPRDDEIAAELTEAEARSGGEDEQVEAVPLLIQLSLEHAIVRGETPEQIFHQLRETGLSEELAELVIIALGKVMQFVHQQDEQQEYLEAQELLRFLTAAGFDGDFAEQVALGVQAFAEAPE